MFQLVLLLALIGSPDPDYRLERCKRCEKMSVLFRIEQHGCWYCIGGYKTHNGSQRRNFSIYYIYP